MATFTSTTNGNLADGATYGNTSPGVRGTDFPGDDDVLVVDIGDTVTMNADATIGSLDIKGTLTTDGTARTLTLDDGGQGYICEHRGTITTTINLTINSNYAGNRLIRLNGTSGNFNDVSITLESTSRVLEFVQNTTIGGNLSILLGKLQPYSSTYNFTVTGSTTIGPNSGAADQATLTCNASAISLGSGITSNAYGLYVNRGGTFVGGTGNHTIGSIVVRNVEQAKCTLTNATTTLNGEHGNDNRQISIEGANSVFNHNNGTVKNTLNANTTYVTAAAALALNNFEQDNNSNLQVSPSLTCAGNFTLTAGEFDTSGSNYAVTVTGDAAINGGQFVGNASAISFGTLEIASGATYFATSGITTITQNSNGGNVWQNLETDGTGFTHNNGTVYIKGLDNYNSNVNIYENTFYNLTVNMNSTSNNCYWYDITGNALTILGDLTIIKGEWERATSGDTLTIHGNTYVEADGFFHTDSTAHTGQVTHHGLVTNSGTYKTAAGDKNALNGGIRNLGTFTSDDTVTIGGTGGILEGNLDDANVNVNLDSSLYFDGNVNDDRMVVSDDNTAATGDFGTGNFSVSCWVYTPSTGFTDSDSWGSILGKGFTTSAPSGGWGLVRTSTNNSIYFQSAADAGGAWSASFGMSSTLTLGAWTHICVTRTGASLIFYVNGVQNNTHTATETSNLTNSGDFKIGTNNTNSQSANITVSDVKLFDDVLTASEIQYLASKVQADPDVGGLDNCESWWKINEGTGTNVVNHKKGAANGTITGAEWQYDKFSVDVYDNSTTTDGTFTVTQGKVEGIGLTSLELAGTSNTGIDLNNALTSTLEDSYTWSMWVNLDDLHGSSDALLGGTDASANDGIIWNINSSGNYGYYMEIGGTEYANNLNYFSAGASGWMNLAVTVTKDSASAFTIKTYKDGQLVKTTTHSANLEDYNGATDIFIGTYNLGGFTRLLTLDGKIKEVKLFDYALSQEQISSLYSNTYLSTPKHYWKIEEGTGTAIEDYGTATDVDGTLTGGSWSNGTLDLDGKFETAANGTLSAPRGKVQVAGDFEPAGFWIHNNGTLETNNTGEKDFNVNASTALYNWIHDGTTLTIENATDGHIVIENALTINSSKNLKFQDGADLTFGTSTQAATVTNNGNFENRNANNNVTLRGASSLYPFAYEGTDINWDQDASAGNVQNFILSNCNWNPDITTGEYVSIQLAGDCEFDAFTLSANSTLDLNGQRVEFGGDVTYSGTLDADGLLVFHGGFTKYGTLNNAASGDIMVVGTSGFPTFSYITGYRTFFTNGGVQLGTGGFTNIPKAIIGSGILKTGTRDPTATDFTIATGAEFQAEDNTLTVAGDFTTSGGLIGKSGLLFDGTNDYMRAGTYGVANNFTGWSNNNITVEVWAKSSDSSQAGIMASRWGASSSRQFILYQEANGSVRAAINSDGGSTYVSTNGAEAGVSNSWTNGRDGKWHHYALTYDGANLKLYIDGQLYANRAIAVTLVNGVNSIFGIGAYNVNSSNTFSANGGFIGDIHRCSVWNHTLTESEIRGMMFYDYATMDADSDFNTPKGDLKGWYQFDEGADSTIDNMQGTDNVDGLLTGATWAGAGTLSWTGGSTPSAGTLNMTGAGTTPTLTCKSATKFFNLTAGTSGEVTLAGHPYIYGLLTVDANGITDGAGAETIGIAGTSTPVVHASQDFSNISQIHYQTGGSAITITPTTYAICRITNSTPATLVGALESTTLQVDSGCSLTAQNTTIQTRGFNINGANVVVNVVGTDITLTDASPYGFTGGNSTTTFSAGPGTTFTGNASKSKFVSSNNFTVVGKAENLDVTNEELSVTGQVINCTGDIIQQFPTIDHDQQLDYDTADDRDVILGRDLDKNTELINS